MEKIHNVFHVSMLRRYRSDHSHVLSAKAIELQPDLTFEEEPVKILAFNVKELRRKSIPIVKVLWQNHTTEEATWELEDTMRRQYPHMFASGNFEDEILFKSNRIVTSQKSRARS